MSNELSVAAVPKTGRSEGARALVTEEIVTGENVVHTQAVGADEALADVALQERLIVNDLCAFAVAEQTFAYGTVARLTHGGW